MASHLDLTRVFAITGGDFVRAGFASIKIKEILRDLGIDPVVIRRTAISAYESEMNAVMYADKSEMVLRLNPEMILITLEDEGPGIEDVDLAMQEGYSTSTQEIREMGFGAGMGLPNIGRNADLFELKSTPGKGTSYHIVIYTNPGGKT